MPSRTGSNLILASLLAFLSYVPFEWVAKGTLVASAILFIWDPIPPLSRLLSLLNLVVVYGISKAYHQHLLQIEQDQEILITEDTVGGAVESDSAKRETENDKKKD
mmetsp:Transcript_57572/g.167203  ORF Transcript_57572/g.167203 Transcript_57572/m.167203 type:complete len:106 (-) Transcript_57572:87-404(-)